MDNRNRVINLCGICGNKRMYKDYHRLYNPCEICVAKNSARYHQVKRDKMISRFNLYQENPKYVRNSHTQLREELNDKIEELTHVMERLILKN